MEKPKAFVSAGKSAAGKVTGADLFRVNKKHPLVSFLLEHNTRQSAIFCSPDAALWREQYRARYPTNIAALKCMDGRLNLAVLTKTPPGLIQPFRNIGGKFDLGWPYFGDLLMDFVDAAVRSGSRSLILVTYHWSAGSTERGCRGFNHDAAAARAYTGELLCQVERVFGSAHTIVYPIQVGIETDEDALTLHGAKGSALALTDCLSLPADELEKRVSALFPDMRASMVRDLLPLLRGNLEHIVNLRASGRPVAEVEHREQILAVGRGFDWLHLPNKALIIGPYSYNLGEPIATAGHLLYENVGEGRTPKKDGVVLLTSTAYREEAGPEFFRAVEKAKSLAQFSYQTLQSAVPALVRNLELLVGVTNLNTRRFTPLAAMS